MKGTKMKITSSKYTFPKNKVVLQKKNVFYHFTEKEIVISLISRGIMSNEKSLKCFIEINSTRQIFHGNRWIWMTFQIVDIEKVLTENKKTYFKPLFCFCAQNIVLSHTEWRNLINIFHFSIEKCLTHCIWTVACIEMALPDQNLTMKIINCVNSKTWPFEHCPILA